MDITQQNLARVVSGVSGLNFFFRHKSDPKDADPKKVVKISKYNDPVTLHEYRIIQTLSRELGFLPNTFNSETGGADYQMVPINTQFVTQYDQDRKKRNHAADHDLPKPPYRNPFTSKGLYKGALITDYIPAESFSDDPIHGAELYSFLQQSILYIMMAQKACDFTHYDFHVDNCLIRRDMYNKRDLLVYVLDEQNQFLVPSAGICPWILDFEYAYTNKTSSLLCSLDHTHVGMTPFCKDFLSDVRLFLCTIAQTMYEEEMKQYSDEEDGSDESDATSNKPRPPRSTECQMMFNIVANLFGKMCALETGWLELTHNQSISEDLVEELLPEEEEFRESVFLTYPNYVIHSTRSIAAANEHEKITDVKRLEIVRLFNKSVHDLRFYLKNEFFQLYLIQLIALGYDRAHDAHGSSVETEARRTWITEFILEHVSVHLFKKQAIPASFSSWIAKALPSFEDMSRLIYNIDAKGAAVRTEIDALYREHLSRITHVGHVFGILESTFPMNLSFEKGDKVIFYDLPRRESYSTHIREPLAKKLTKMVAEGAGARMSIAPFLYESYWEGRKSGGESE